MGWAALSDCAAVWVVWVLLGLGVLGSYGKGLASGARGEEVCGTVGGGGAGTGVGATMRRPWMVPGRVRSSGSGEVCETEWHVVLGHGGSRVVDPGGRSGPRASRSVMLASIAYSLGHKPYSCHAHRGGHAGGHLHVHGEYSGLTHTTRWSTSGGRAEPISGLGLCSRRFPNLESDSQVPPFA